VLGAVENGLPVKAIAALFQHDVNGLLTHPDVTSLGELKNKTLLMSTTARVSWWPWLKSKFGLSDEQTRPYTFNIQPFMADPQAAQQAFPSSEPFTLDQQGVPYHFFLFADDGYPPYGITLVTRNDIIADRPDVLRRFIRASLQGWKSYLAHPEPGNSLIKQANPKMSDEQLAFAVARIKQLHFVTGGDAASSGIGTMTPARWRADYDYMVAAGLLKASTNWKNAFTTEFIDDLHVKPD
jgi:NitT/TauT family transport system substrate-binding protein